MLKSFGKLFQRTPPEQNKRTPEQIKKNEANEFIQKQIKKQKEKKELEKFNLNFNEKKEKLVEREKYLKENTTNSNKIRSNRHNQSKYQIKKMNINKKYILNKLETNNYNLLYRLINSLFDTKLSEPSKDKFEEYLSQNPDKKKDIMKILKSVYRLKLNKSMENKKEEINKKAKKLEDNRNKFLAEIKDISSHIDLATGFHDFTGIEYYICNEKQLKELNDNKNISEIPLQDIINLSPIFYANGIFCFNSKIKEYTSNTKTTENLEELSKNNVKGIKVSKINNKVNKSNSNMVDIDRCIENIKSFNRKDSLLSKFFEQKILGMPTEYGVQEEDKINKNENKYINIPNFESFCAEFGNFIDTIVIVKGTDIQPYTTQKTPDEINKKNILTEYFAQQNNLNKKYLQQKEQKGDYIQYGGVVDPIVGVSIILLSFVIGFITSLRRCKTKKKEGLIENNKYMLCIRHYTLVYSIFIMAIPMLGFLAWMGIKFEGVTFWGFKWVMDGDISNKSYTGIFKIINEFHKSDDNVSLRDLKMYVQSIGHKNLTLHLKNINQEKKRDLYNDILIKYRSRNRKENNRV